MQGQLDIPLNAVGRDQAFAAGRKLKRLLAGQGLEPTQVRFIASPLGRTRATMERVRTALGLPAEAYETDDRLKELSFGTWEGLTWPELKTMAPALVRERKRSKWTFVPPGGESYAQLGERLAPWLGHVRHQDAVVAHGGVARVLMHLVAGVPTAEAPNVEIVQGRILRFSRGRYQWF